MNETDKKILEANGWSVDCESPFEISHQDGSFASGQAADYVLLSLQEESVVMKFSDLALGARFQYLSQAVPRTWIKLSNCGLIAEYDPEHIKHRRWAGQQICNVADTPEQLNQIEVILME